MSATLIIQLITWGAQAIQNAYALYEASSSTLSETDNAKVKAALSAAQAQTAAIRPLVDAALDDAAKK